MLTHNGEITNVYEAALLGAFPGAKLWNKFGFGIVGTTYSTVFSAGALPGLYTYLDAPQLVSVASTDVDDTALGTGGNLVWIFGFDANGKMQDEYISLAGQTPVESTKIYSRIRRVINVSRDGHDLEGQLYVGPNDATWVLGEPDHILAHVNDGYNQTQMGMDTVPKDYTLLVYAVVIATPRDKEIEVAAFARDANLGDLALSGVMAIKVNWLVSNGSLPIVLANSPFVFPELTDFEFRAKVDAGTASVTANAQGVFIPNKYIKI